MELMQQKVRRRAVLRRLLIGSGFVAASLATYLGVAVYALTLGPKAIGPYIRDRVIAGALVAIALTLDTLIAWSLKKHGSGNIGLTMLLSILLTLAGAVAVLVIIAAIAIARHQFQPS